MLNQLHILPPSGASLAPDYSRMTKVSIPNKYKESIQGRVYSDLFNKGGDGLLSLYLLIKHLRRNYRHGIITPVKSRNGKFLTGIPLIKHLLKGKVSRSVVSKYIQTLIDLKLINITSEGGVHVVGMMKLNHRYYGKRGINHKKWKLLIIKAKNYKELKDYCYRIRIHSNAERQKRKILNISTRKRRIFLKGKPNGFLSIKDIKKVRKDEKKMKENPDVFKVREDVCLSNLGFSKLKNGSRCSGSGYYWKKKLKNRGLLTTKRTFMVYMKFKTSFHARRFMKTNRLPLLNLGVALFISKRNPRVILQEKACSIHVKMAVDKAPETYSVIKPFLSKYTKSPHTQYRRAYPTPSHVTANFLYDPNMVYNTLIDNTLIRDKATINS